MRIRMFTRLEGGMTDIVAAEELLDFGAYAGLWRAATSWWWKRTSKAVTCIGRAAMSMRCWPCETSSAATVGRRRGRKSPRLSATSASNTAVPATSSADQHPHLVLCLTAQPLKPATASSALCIARSVAAHADWPGSLQATFQGHRRENLKRTPLILLS